MIKHPRNKFERKLVKEKHETKKTEDRSGRVWRKLSEAQAKLQETKDELARANAGSLALGE